MLRQQADRAPPHLRRQARPLHDIDGQAVARRVKEMAQYLIRPDGHNGYRCGGTDLDSLQHYLAHRLPNPTPHPA